MPRPPGTFDKVNYVIDAWSNPCKAPWVVYVEALKPAALVALVSLVCFDIFDVARWIFRPAAANRSGRHGRKGRKGQRRTLVSRTRSKVPPWRALSRRHVTDGVKHLWVFDQFTQRLLWWWLVVDVATEFTYNFTTLVYKSEFCQMAAAPGNELREDDDDIRLGIQGWQAVGFEQLQYTEGAVQSDAFSAQLGDGHWAVFASMDWENEMTNDVSGQIRIRVTSDPDIPPAEGPLTNIAPGSRGGSVATIQITGPASIVYEARSVGGNLTKGSGILYIQGVPPEVPPPTKFKCGPIEVSAGS